MSFIKRIRKTIYECPETNIKIVSVAPNEIDVERWEIMSSEYRTIYILKNWEKYKDYSEKQFSQLLLSRIGDIRSSMKKLIKVKEEELKKVNETNEEYEDIFKKLKKYNKGINKDEII